MADEPIESAYAELEAAIRSFAEQAIADARASIEQQEARNTALFAEVQQMIERQPRDGGPASSAPVKPDPERTGHNETPALSGQLTVTSLAQQLSSLGYTVLNKRPVGGALWVIATRKEFGPVEKVLKVKGIACRYYPNGRRKHPGPQFWVDTAETLPS